MNYLTFSILLAIVFVTFTGCIPNQYESPFGFPEEVYCYGDVKGSSELYYLGHQDSVYSYADCKKGNRTLDRINQLCYYNGSDHQDSFDLIEDYGFSCKQIEYINDHFVQEIEKKGSGEINGELNSFFSYGYINGKSYQWINKENLATGNLIKNAKYHLDCKNSTLFWKIQYICNDGKVFPSETSQCIGGRNKIKDTKELEYYSKEDFIMYYVDRCITEEK